MFSPIDLHTHTFESDGMLSPQALMARAEERGLTHLAIADHDTTAAIEALTEHSFGQVNLIPAIEISAAALGREVHVVGLMLDVNNQPLQSALRLQQQARWQRLEQIDERLRRCGISGVAQQVHKSVKHVVTRTHIARAMVELQAVPDLQAVFKKYLGKKGRAYVRGEWMPLAQVIELIHQAGGLAVLAHPGRYPLAARQLRQLVTEFKALGGDGLEVSYSNLQPNMRKFLKDLALEHQLLGSQGSDFHDPAMQWVDLGRIQPVPSELTPVWEMWDDVGLSKSGPS